MLSATPGVEEIRETDFSGLSSAALERLPEFTAVAAPDAWFTYYYWLDDTKAPDFARCVDIHRKPGYDPAEMFFDPGLAFPMFHAAAFLLKKAGVPRPDESYPPQWRPGKGLPWQRPGASEPAARIHRPGLPAGNSCC